MTNYDFIKCEWKFEGKLCPHGVSKERSGKSETCKDCEFAEILWIEAIGPKVHVALISGKNRTIHFADTRDLVKIE